jgi:two-component system chemotaxis sensor kinase CheA
MEIQTVKKDPMMEIFIEECSDLVTQYETYLSMAAERNEYTMDIVNEIFRITHTIKADATMMLFESLSTPMRAFERILYFYRDEKAGIDFDRFTELLRKLVEYSVTEIDRLMDGTASEDDGKELTDEFRNYRDEIAGDLKVETVEDVEKTVKAESRDEPMRFYIGSAELSAEESAKPTRFETIKSDTRTANRIVKEERAAVKAAGEGGRNKGKKKTADVAVLDTEAGKNIRKHLEGREKQQEELKELYGIIKRLSTLEANMSDEKRNFPGIIPFVSKLHEHNLELLNWLVGVSTIPMGHISPKLHKTVEEMNQRLGRDIKLEIEGEQVLVDREWIDGLSGALVHMLRNAVDHGIETKELRISRGKSPEGKIRVSYANDGNSLKIQVSDDGRGIDIEKLRASAIERGLIFEGDEIADDDIIRLIFVPGVSTNEKEGIYSGRGVGMDAVLHNVEVLGGKVTTDTREGEGTTFTIIIPLNAVLNGNGGEEQDEDEDIDSRR